jgi:hypothetical protein
MTMSSSVSRVVRPVKILVGPDDVDNIPGRAL